jgi:hypothetical protein
MTKLNQAKEKLSHAFADLELVILNKLNQKKHIEAKNTIGNSNENKNNQDVSSNLYNEINSLQNSLAELGEENELLRIKNQELKNFKSQAGEVVNYIQIDLAKIKSIINQN